MKTFVLAALLVELGATAASAQTLQPGLKGLEFLLGRWTSAAPGAVAETGGSATGESVFTAEAGGQMILRRDHTELKDGGGAASGGFDQLMTIWPEDGAIRAVYGDGSHLIRYTRAEVVPGRSVVFTSAPQPGAPTFRLNYAATAPGVLSVSFGMLPPGGGAVRPIASGTLRKAP